MSFEMYSSILDEALACVGQRITSILIQPADRKDKNYIASLHNEVVRPQLLSAEGHMNSEFILACSSMDYWPSVIKWQFS